MELIEITVYGGVAIFLVYIVVRVASAAYFRSKKDYDQKG